MILYNSVSVCVRVCVQGVGNENILELVIKGCIGMFQFLLTFHMCLELGLYVVLLILILIAG